MISIVKKNEIKRYITEIRKAHDVIIEQIYAHKDVVDSTKNGLAPRLPDDNTKFLDGTGQWSEPRHFQGYITSSTDLEELYAINNGTESSSPGNLWLMKSTIGSLEEGDLLLKTGTGENDWKIIKERPTTSGTNIEAGRGLDFRSQSDILDVDLSYLNMPANNSTFNINKSDFSGEASFNTNVLNIYSNGISIGNESEEDTQTIDYTVESRVYNDGGGEPSAGWYETITETKTKTISETTATTARIISILEKTDKSGLIIITSTGRYVIGQGETIGTNFTAGRGLELTSNNILNVNFTNCYGANVIPAFNAAFDMRYKNNPKAISTLRIQTVRYPAYSNPYIGIVQGPDFDGVRIGSTVVDYYFEGDSGGDDYYYDSGSDDYYYYSGGDDYYYSDNDDSGSDDYYY